LRERHSSTGVSEITNKPKTVTGWRNSNPVISEESSKSTAIEVKAVEIVPGIEEK
jgi:hypothetical protein